MLDAFVGVIERNAKLGACIVQCIFGIRSHHAIMDAFEAHQTMSSQALGSVRVREGLRDIL